MQAPVTVVQAMLDYEIFASDYKKVYLALNKPT